MTNDRDLAAQLRSIEADITTLSVDAIVNAANEPLIRGGGVDGAIRRKAGPDIERELRAIGRCATGDAVITKGHRLPAKFVIHTVAPIWRSRADHEEQDHLLSLCYEKSLSLADENGLLTVAFPCIGTGIYGWPAERAADIAFKAVLAHLRASPRATEATFCCFSTEDRKRYQTLIDSLGA